MKFYSRRGLSVFLIAAIFFLAGCGKESVTAFKPEGKSIGQVPTYQEGEALLGEESLANSGNGNMYGSEMKSDAYKKEFGRSTAPLLPVYFDFDRDEIRSDQVKRIDKNGAYLLEHPATRIMIAGNCDERGTSEYNMGLGERRAIQAKKHLIRLGITEDRIRTVSFGDEMPLFSGSDEWTWSQNRRDDFVME